ncbi:hypothetical protein VTP01DRAFT_5666 [Rhizomucor pusillus]|uniref:uncharacterized protein n=1 Tax=Rhizomucor pusillus TaxID=4840 RepID=UPI0037436A01
MFLSKSARYPPLRQAILGRRSIAHSIALQSDKQGAGVAATGNKPALKKTDWSAAKPTKNKEWKRSPSKQQSSSVPKPRDWSLPPEQKQKIRAKEPTPDKKKQHRKDESASERRERKRREEEMQALMKEEELAKRRLAEKHAKEQRQSEAEKQIPDVYVPQVISVANLSRLFGVRLEQLVQTMHELEMDNVSPDRVLTADESSLIAMQLDMNPIVDERQSLDLFPKPPPGDISKLPPRPPVVTIMGHVDHGKTTLLDTLRKTSVAAGEAGGITQHIGAFSVQLPSKKSITFLDTPGHAAFTAMRARGAQVTDVVVLVVAADDGVMPQTQEAIKHAQNAGVPMVVAINKCDKPGVDPSRVKQELARYNVHLEEIGGDVPAVEVSGLTGKNLDQLEETIVTLSEVLELRAERDNEAEGVVLEAQVEKGRGNVATILVRRGTLKPGATVVAGQTWCKVRSMTDHTGKVVREATPGMPVKVIGWKEVPAAGDEMLQAPNESTAKTVVDNRIARLDREQQLRDLKVINDKRRQQRHALEQERLVEQQYKKEMYMYQQGLIDTPPESLAKRLSALQTQLESDEVEKSDDGKLEYRVVVKGDVSGTVEAVVDCLGGLMNKQIAVRVVDSGVGNITEGDIQRAAACEGHVIGFNVKADKKVQGEASKLGVQVRSYNVIYKLLEEVKDQLSDMLPPVVTTQVNGEATILQVFDIQKKGKETQPVAGCRVTNGTIMRNHPVRVLRDKKILWEGPLEALRQVKKDITEAKKGLECGMSFEGFKEFKAGDVIQSIQNIETKQRL